jgi:hypothetical protein
LRKSFANVTLEDWVQVVNSPSAYQVFANFTDCITTANGAGATHRCSIALIYSINDFTVDFKKNNVAFTRGKGLTIMCAPMGWPASTTIHRMLVLSSRLGGAFHSCIHTKSATLEDCRVMLDALRLIGARQHHLLPLQPEGIMHRVLSSFDEVVLYGRPYRCPLTYLEQETLADNSLRQAVYHLTLQQKDTDQVIQKMIGSPVLAQYYLPAGGHGISFSRDRAGSGQADVFQMHFVRAGTTLISTLAAPSDAAALNEFLANRETKRHRFVALTLAQVAAALWHPHHAHLRSALHTP